MPIPLTTSSTPAPAPLAIALALAVVAAGPLACASAARAANDDARTARARAIADKMKGQLLLALEASLKSAGAAGSIEVCSASAPAIAQALSVDGITIGRTGARLRNPNNAPRPWVVPLLAQLAERAAQKDARPLSAPLPDGGLGVLVPITTGAPCLQCHGTDIAPDVKAALAARYPKDSATGFREGDLRGAFWIEVAKTPDARTLAGRGAAVLDVRNPDEWAVDHLERSTLVPLPELGLRLAEVATLVGGDKSKPIVVVCRSGARAEKAKALLEQNGFTFVVNGGGFDSLR